MKRNISGFRGNRVYFAGGQNGPKSRLIRMALSAKLTRNRKMLRDLAEKFKVEDTAKVTEFVKLLSRQNFKPGKITSPEFVQNVLHWLTENIAYAPESEGFTKLLYGKISAEDVLSSRTIATKFDARGTPFFGCGYLTDAFIALLKTFPKVEGIKHVRLCVPAIEKGKLALIPHSIALFYLPLQSGKKAALKPFLADPFLKGHHFLGTGKTLAPLEGSLAQKAKLLKRFGVWKEGNSLVDFNKSFSEYEKEMVKANRIAKKQGEEILEAFGGVV